MSASDCIFCKIVAGEIPCTKLLETQDILAFLDIFPVHPGHALVVPKAHHETLWDLPEAAAAAMMHAAARLSKAVMAATRADGLNLVQNNLEPAGQLVPHAHIHLVPRYVGDGLDQWKGKPYSDQQAMNRFAEMIRRALA